MPEKGIDIKSKMLLFETIERLSSDDFIELLQSLMSSVEIKNLSRRIMVAKLLKTGATYEEIVDKMGMSESTVNKIHFKTKGSPIINKLYKKG